MHRRIDYMDAELSAPIEGPAGSILMDGVAARPGIYIYRNADGSLRRELVTRDSLWDPRSIESLARAPITNDHPPDFVTPENVRLLTHGDVGTKIIERKNGHVQIQLALRTKEIQDDIKAGKTQLSPGYDVECLEKGGVHPEFGRYDAEQLFRTYNHLAVVDRARGGDSMSMRTDALEGAPEIESKNDAADKARTDATELIAKIKTDAETDPADVLKLITAVKEDRIAVIPDRGSMGTGITYELFEEAIIGLKAQISEMLAPMMDALAKIDQNALASAASAGATPPPAGTPPGTPPQATGAKDQENPEETAVEEEDPAAAADPAAAGAPPAADPAAPADPAAVPPKKKKAPVADAAEVREDGDSRKRLDDLARDLQVDYDPGVSAGDLARAVISKVRPDLILKTDSENIAAALMIEKPATFEKPRIDAANAMPSRIKSIYGPQAEE